MHYFGADAVITNADLQYLLDLSSSLVTDARNVLTAPPDAFYSQQAEIIEKKIALYQYAIEKLQAASQANQQVLAVNAKIMDQINANAFYLGGPEGKTGAIGGIRTARTKSFVWPAGVKVPTYSQTPSTTQPFAAPPVPPAGSLFAPKTAIPIIELVERVKVPETRYGPAKTGVTTTGNPSMTPWLVGGAAIAAAFFLLK